MSFRIALCGLEVSNLGDQVILDTAQYLLRQVLTDLGAEDCEIEVVNIGTPPVRKNASAGALQRVAARRKFGLKRKLSAAATWVSQVAPLRPLVHALVCPLLTLIWHRSAGYAFYAKKARRQLLDCDAVVFAGGGLVKYHRQDFHYLLDDITALADRRKMPVILNAVGVEGYEMANPECAILARALRRRCVVSVTTRDDVDMLVSHYRTRPTLPVKAVSDPAFWIDVTYGAKAVGLKGNLQGLNVIRPKIFGEYGRAISEDELAELYLGIAERILLAGDRVEFFTNGSEEDGMFLSALRSRRPDLFSRKDVSVVCPVRADELVMTISRYRRFVAARLHASIIGTVLGIPNVSLVWNRKQRFFGQRVGLAGNYLERDQFAVDDVCSMLEGAVPYAMDAAYRMSVYESLRMAVRTALEIGE